MSDAALLPTPSPAPSSWHVAALAWVRANPVPVALWTALVVTLGVFYGAVPLYYNHSMTAFRWAYGSWNSATHYEHGPLVPVIALGLVWFALPQLRVQRSKPDNLGLLPLILGLLLFVLSARTLQPRLALVGLPLILLGVVLYLYGRGISHTLLFPICCLLFMIPVPGVDQATVRLQLFAAKAAQVICSYMGLKLVAVGASLHAVDQSFSFEIAEGCSGINSLMAITLMTAVFAHLTQDRLWKKLILFVGSVPVAIIGNIARLVSIMVVARLFGQTIAGGWFHDISPYIISFPFAFGSLCLLNKILNLSFGDKTAPGDGKPLPPPTPVRPAAVLPHTPSYDY